MKRTLVILFFVWTAVFGLLPKAVLAAPYTCSGVSILGYYLSTTGVATAIGCVPVAPVELLKFLLRWVLGASGGLILLMLIITAYSLAMSQGNPEKLQAAKENLISLFSGIIMIGFSLVLLQTIGADVLSLAPFK